MTESELLEPEEVRNFQELDREFVEPECDNAPYHKYIYIEVHMVQILAQLISIMSMETITSLVNNFFLHK